MFSRIRTLGEAHRNFMFPLTKLYDEQEARSITNLVFSDLLGYDTIKLILNEKDLLPASVFEQLDHVLHQLLSHRPVQYVLGKADFYGLSLKVNEHTLIPRPETEELVHWILQEHQEFSEIRILDIGTGSGCIPVSIGKNRPQWKITAIDISDGALKVAKENAEQNQVQVNFELQDVFLFEPAEQYHLIISNPPYVLNSEKQEMRKNVLDHEPHAALFVDDQDALKYYTRIAELASQKLYPGGVLYLEINEQKGAEMITMLSGYGFSDVELRQDLSGRDRMIKATTGV